MRLMTFDAGAGARVGLAVGGGIVDLTARIGVRSLRGMIAAGRVEEARAFVNSRPDHGEADVRLLPVIPDPDKIFCAGTNYADHLAEAAAAGVTRTRTEHPPLFIRTAATLVGHGEPILRPRVSDHLDYECELAVIIGRPGRHIAKAEALSYVAGYSCFNDASVRDWQFHTHQVTPGKNFAATGGFGPAMVTPDEVGDPQALDIATRVNGKVLQHANTRDMIFDIVTLISYISTFQPLGPGDVIATGTCAGVALARKPPNWMKPGDTCEIAIEKVGTLVNPIGQEGA
ncbi:MAG: fumarylacetoacetate hydrolase family protein [Alphaproteobacteria bacterium]